MKSTNRNIPYGIKSIAIETFRGIQSASVDGISPNMPWIFLTGNNGYGKTCLLQAMFIGFGGVNREQETIIENEEYSNEDGGYDLNEDDEPFFNRIDHVSLTTSIVPQGRICEKSGSLIFVVTTLQKLCSPLASAKLTPILQRSKEKRKKAVS